MLLAQAAWGGLNYCQYLALRYIIAPALYYITIAALLCAALLSLVLSTVCIYDILRAIV
jgi:hypothetical protein